ncbi:MAG: cobalamin-dependent protein [Deltaproteobacteria bacterium]|nr:cobalamin-dependent protein [Deltaproteobacteria bacterium]
MNDTYFSTMKEHVLAFNEAALLEIIEKALNQGVAPADIISDGLSPGLEMIGQKFEVGEYFLPELMLSGNIMKNALDKIRPHMLITESKMSGTVLLGTAEGDIHYIGKNIFGAVLEGDGYKVHDLGVDVSPQTFLGKAKEVNPDIIGISALISVAVSKIAETIALLKENNIQTKVIVGGAALTRENTKTIGADGYGADAWQGLRITRELIAGEEGIR